MSSTRYDMRIYCDTESQWVEGTTKDADFKKCFHNIAHSVRETSREITNTISPQMVRLAEEETATGGNYKCDTVAFSAAAATVVDGVTLPTVTFNDIEYPFPINLLSTSCTIDDTHKRNVLDVYFVPDSVIGGTTQIDGINTDSILVLPGLVLATIPVGATISVTDGQGTANVGTVVSKNANENQITVSGDVPRPFNLGSTVNCSYATTTGTTVSVTGAAVKVNSGLAAAAFVGLNIKVAGVSVGVVTAISGNVLTVSGTPAARGVVALTAETTLGTAISVTGNEVTVNPELAAVAFVGLNVSVDGASAGVVTAVSGDVLTVSGAPAATGAVELSFSTATGAVTSVTGSAITVNSELAAVAFVGLGISVDGTNVGVVTAISGNVLTVSGTPVIGTVELSLPTVTTTLADDFLPRNVLEVQDTCIQYGQVGMNIKITDGVHLDNLGRIVSLDKATKRIKVEFAPSRDYPPGSYIMVTRYFIEKHEFGGAGVEVFSGGRNKGSYMDTGKIGRFAYTNYSTSAVRFTMKLEYLH